MRSQSGASGRLHGKIALLISDHSNEFRLERVSFRFLLLVTTGERGIRDHGCSFFVSFSCCQIA
jgi:hypothetical protein